MSEDSYLQPLLEKGIQLLQARSFTEAQWYFEQIIAVNPKHAASIINLGVISAQLKQPKKAKTYFEEGVILDPNEFAAWQGL